MEVLKSFRRNGEIFSPGDDLPDGLDAVTIAHYRRHGMIGAPDETKPAAPGRRRVPARPAEKKPGDPAEKKVLSSEQSLHHAQAAASFAAAAAVAQPSEVQTSALPVDSGESAQAAAGPADPPAPDPAVGGKPE